jgi:hypothetical protein
MLLTIIILIICIIVSHIIIKLDNDVEEIFIKQFSTEMFNKISELTSNINIGWFIIGLCVGIMLTNFILY